jgi:hypothetical protein
LIFGARQSAADPDLPVTSSMCIDISCTSSLVAILHRSEPAKPLARREDKKDSDDATRFNFTAFTGIRSFIAVGLGDRVR